MAQASDAGKTVSLLASTLGQRERLEGQGSWLEDQARSRLRDPASPSWSQDAIGRQGLENQSDDPSRLGTKIHQGSIREALQGIGIPATTRLVLTDMGQLDAGASDPGRHDFRPGVSMRGQPTGGGPDPSIDQHAGGRLSGWGMSNVKLQAFVPRIRSNTYGPGPDWT